MFGIFALIAQAIGSVYYDATMYGVTEEKRYDAVQKRRDTYYDSRGRMWYIPEKGRDILVGRRKNFNNGHDVLVSLKNPNYIVKDYTAEQEQEEILEFQKQYNEAKEQAIKDGKKYFYVHGLKFTDKRYGYYELETERLYDLDFDFWNQNARINYYEATKKEIKLKNIERITKERYYELGGYCAERDTNAYDKSEKAYRNRFKR